MIGRLIDILVFAVIALSGTIWYMDHIITFTASIGITIFVLVFIRTGRKCRFPKYFILPWIFIAYDLISIAWAQDLDWALGCMIQYQSAVLLGTAIWFSLFNGTSPRVVVAGLAVGATLGIISCIPEVLRYGFGTRIAGVFENPNSLAMFCSYAAFAVWFGLDKKPKWADWIAGVFVIFPFLFSGSRKMFIVIFVLGIAALWALFMHPMPRVRRRILAILIVLMMVGSHFLLSHLEELQVYNRGLELLHGTSRTEDRGAMIVMGWELWKKNPVFGYGSGQFAPVSGMPYYSHNTYIELLVNDGLIGLVLYYALMGIAIFRAKQKIRFPQASYPGAIWILLLIFCVNFGMSVLGDFSAWIFMCFASHLALIKASAPDSAGVVISVKTSPVMV